MVAFLLIQVGRKILYVWPLFDPPSSRKSLENKPVLYHPVIVSTLRRRLTKIGIEVRIAEDRLWHMEKPDKSGRAYASLSASVRARAVSSCASRYSPTIWWNSSRKRRSIRTPASIADMISAKQRAASSYCPSPKCARPSRIGRKLTAWGTRMTGRLALLSQSSGCPAILCQSQNRARPAAVSRIILLSWARSQSRQWPSV
jgi:hypothetical protein